MSTRDGTKVAVKISVHEETNDETGEERFTVHDDGGEFDSEEVYEATEIQNSVDERRHHYAKEGFVVCVQPDHCQRWR